jgi:hypothetical protein
VQAIDLLTANVSIRDVVAATGMGHGSVQRLRQTLIRQGVPIGVPQDRGTPAETDRGGNDDALPVGGSGRVAPAAPPDAIAKSEAGASTREDDEATRDDVLAVQPAPRVAPQKPASDTCEHISGVILRGDQIECAACGATADPIPPSPAGGESDAGTLPTAAASSPCAVPAGDPDDWERQDSAGNHAEAVRAVREGIETHGKDYPTALRQRLEAAINDLGSDPQVADIARRTLALYESGDVHGAAIIVDAVKRGATYPALPGGLDRRRA